MAAVRWLNYLLLAALIAFTIVAWPSLPERIPTHFGASGEPDAWASRGWSWFLLPAVGALTFGVMLFSMRLVEKRPHLLNIPHKQQFLALPHTDQQPILAFTVHTLHALNTIILLMFLAIQYATYRAAFGASTRALMMSVLLLSLVAIPAIALVLLAKTSAMVTEAHRRARARGALQP